MRITQTLLEGGTLKARVSSPPTTALSISVPANTLVEFWTKLCIH